MPSQINQLNQLRAFLLMVMVWHSLSLNLGQARMQLRNYLTGKKEIVQQMILAKGHGFGGATAGGAAKAKSLIVVIILVLIVPFIALLFSGATTGSGGLYGNSTIGYAVRQSTYSFSLFIVLVLVLGALVLVLSFL